MQPSPMQLTPEFKKISLAAPRALSESAKRAIGELNGAFAPDEFSVEVNGNGVEILLRRLDVRALREAVAGLSTRHRLSANSPLHRIERAVLDIKSYGLAGGKRDYVGYNRERKVVARKRKERQRGRLAYARGNGFAREEAEAPARFVDKIVCGDAVKTLRKLPDNCVDLVFTSPPYNFGLDYEQSDDEFVWESYFEQLFAVFEECIRVVKYGGRIAVNIQPLFSDYVPSHHIIGEWFMRRKMIWRGEILWEKNNYNCKYTAWGSWKSPSNPYLKYSWEFVELFCKGDLKKPGISDAADITADEFKKWVYGKWSIAPERGMTEKYGHPAMFPEELARRVLKLFSFRGDLVLDPFNGAGTTTAVAKKTGRHWLGVDISPDYCKTARRRLAEILL